MSEHRVPMLGASWRRSEDPAHSRDPRVRALVGALATLPSPEPGEQFRAELRAQLVAIAPRIIAESAGAAAPTRDSAAATTRVVEVPAVAGKPKHADGVFARLRGISLGRPLAVAASVLTAFVLLLGGAVWMSHKALPGDTLYGLKRASESFELWTAGSDTEKARDLLKFAGRRVDEAHGLASRAAATAMGPGVHAGGIDSHTADLISSTLGSADADVRDATALLSQQAVSTKSVSPLKILTDWAPSQLDRLRSLAAAMPEGALRSRAQSSAQLVTAATNRADALGPAVASGCSPTSSDALGPDPLGGCTVSPSVLPTTTSTPPHPGRTGVNTITGPVVNPVTSDNSSSNDPRNSNTPSTTLPVLPSITITPLPTLPRPTLPIGSCGVHLTLGPLPPVNFGSCSSSP